MVAANSTTVNYLGNAGIPMIQRVVRTPRFWIKSYRQLQSTVKRWPADPDSKRSQVSHRRRKSIPNNSLTCPLTVIKLIGPGE